jgi:type II secretory pathway component PulF
MQEQVSSKFLEHQVLQLQNQVRDGQKAKYHLETDKKQLEDKVGE